MTLCNKSLRQVYKKGSTVSVFIFGICLLLCNCWDEWLEEHQALTPEESEPKVN